MFISVQLIIILQIIKKKLSLDKDYLNNYITKNEVNSGSCSSDTINIWRKEEILKVTLHECIHLLNYDLKNEDNFLKEHYRKRYNITSKKMNIFEAYTEIWSELINIYLIVKLQKGNKHLFSKYIIKNKLILSANSCVNFCSIVFSKVFCSDFRFVASNDV